MSDSSFDKVQFLIVCIKHTSNGRPDFQKVSDELSLPSKGAASMRYTRLLKAAGVSSTGTDTTPKKPSPTKRNKDDLDDGEEGTPSKKARKTPTRKAAVKKEEAAEDSGHGEEDEDAKAVKAEDEA